jgi:orotate phosphoribosyltransferase
LVEPEDRVIIVEDIVTTGISMRETQEALQGGRTVRQRLLARACIIDRSNGKADVGGPSSSRSLAVDFPDYAPDSCRRNSRHARHEARQPGPEMALPRCASV